MIAGVEFNLKTSSQGSHVMPYRQLRVKDLRKVPTWWIEVESNQWPPAPKAPNTTTQPPRPICLMNWRKFNLICCDCRWFRLWRIIYITWRQRSRNCGLRFDDSVRRTRGCVMNWRTLSRGCRSANSAALHSMKRKHTYSSWMRWRNMMLTIHRWDLLCLSGSKCCRYNIWTLSGPLLLCWFIQPLIDQLPAC